MSPNKGLKRHGQKIKIFILLSGIDINIETDKFNVLCRLDIMCYALMQTTMHSLTVRVKRNVHFTSYRSHAWPCFQKFRLRSFEPTIYCQWKPPQTVIQVLPVESPMRKGPSIFINIFPLQGRKGGGGVKRSKKMLVFGHNFLRPLKLENVAFVHKKGEGGQKVITVLFIRENVDNYGWPLNYF